jgi:hypothetical protein
VYEVKKNTPKKLNLIKENDESMDPFKKVESRYLNIKPIKK